MSANPYETGVLVQEHHDRLVADIDRYAADAAIQNHWIWTPLADVCGPKEVEYARKFKQHKKDGVYGLLLHGAHPSVDPEDRMQALAGCLVRNFIRARVMTAGQVAEALEEGSMPDVSCLLIPNFCTASTTLPPWRVSALYDYLVLRRMAARQTVIYASTMKEMAAVYGSPLEKLVKQNYQHVQI